MNKDLQILDEVTTMSSLEVAKLTKKEHKHVLADIRKMLNELNFNDLRNTQLME